jgi:hypothetical protein
MAHQNIWSADFRFMQERAQFSHNPLASSGARAWITPPVACPIIGANCSERGNAGCDVFLIVRSARQTCIDDYHRASSSLTVQMQTVSTNIYQLAPCRVASFESPRCRKLIYGSSDNSERGQNEGTKAQPFGPAPKHVSPSRRRAHFPLNRCSYFPALPVVRAKPWSQPSTNPIKESKSAMISEVVCLCAELAVFCTPRKCRCRS